MDFKPEITPVDALEEYEGKIQIHARVCGDERMKVAVELMGNLGIIACEDTGTYDKDGQPIRKLSSPENVAKRACEITAAAFAEFEKREWLHAVPTRADITAHVKAVKAEREVKAEAERIQREADRLERKKAALAS